MLPNNLQWFPIAKSTKSRCSDRKQARTIHHILGHSLASAWFLTTSPTQPSDVYCGLTMCAQLRVGSWQ